MASGSDALYRRGSETNQSGGNSGQNPGQSGGNSGQSPGQSGGNSGQNPGQSGGNSGQNPSSGCEGGSFECNICLDTAKDAVVSLCGHLFCWPCLHQWLETKPLRQVCPVCKAAISRDKVIPLYGRGSSRSDPRDKLPPRPQGQRSEPDPAHDRSNFPGFTGFGSDGGFHMSFGIGAFPFGFFASAFNIHDGTRGPNGNLYPGENQDDVLISKLFLWVAIAFIVWLLLA